jgi:hypothetical protein
VNVLVAELWVSREDIRAEPKERLMSEDHGGRCRIRTYDFHRVKVTLYR